MANELESLDESWWLPLYEFVVHVVVGTGIFILIAIPAIGLDVCIQYLAENNTNELIIWGLSAAEYLLFGVDIILFFGFIIVHAYKACRKLWK